ncbi:hypothetical protein B0H13DRAFT_2345438 [Mycena leptocephala]|nr:hypothetical protein B0H13DRAFT_2345438 [Mycena leptocephala]
MSVPPIMNVCQLAPLDSLLAVYRPCIFMERHPPPLPLLPPSVPPSRRSSLPMCGRRLCSTHERATIAEHSGHTYRCWDVRRSCGVKHAPRAAIFPPSTSPVCPSVSLQRRPVVAVVLEDLDITSALCGARVNVEPRHSRSLETVPSPPPDVPAAITVRIHSHIRSLPPLSQIPRDRIGRELPNRFHCPLAPCTNTRASSQRRLASFSSVRFSHQYPPSPALSSSSSA